MRWITLVVGAVLVVAFLVCTGLFGLFDAPLTAIAILAFGWLVHAFRLAKEMALDVNGTLTAGIALTLFVVGLHLLARKWRASTNAVNPWSWRATWSVTGLVLGVAVAGIAAVGIAHQSVWLAAEPRWVDHGRFGRAASRIQSSNHLKQIGLAAHSVFDESGFLPSGATFDATGRALHSWASHLLPYVEQQQVFKRLRLDRPWTASDNQDTFKQSIDVYLNPALAKQQPGDLAPCHYAANVHVVGAVPRKLADITDGTTNTILFGEAAGQFRPWGQPGNWRDPALGINASPAGFGNPSMAAAQFVMADGSVRLISETVSPHVVKALATPAGGEKIERGEWESVR